MNTDFIRSFLNQLDSNTLVRIKIISTTLNRLSKFHTLFKYKSIQKIYSTSVFGKSFLDTFEDLSKFNIHKMNSAGLVVKTVSKIKPVYSFLSKHSEIIEKSFRWIVKFDEYTSFGAIISTIAPYMKKVTIGITLFDIGRNLYKNYTKTKSIAKTLLGTIVDVVSDVGVIEGIMYGSAFGVHGMVIGAVAGGLIQATKFVVPSFFNVIKNYLYKKVDQVKAFFTPKPAETSLKSELIFELHKDVLHQRIKFYNQVLVKLKELQHSLQQFQKNFSDYASGVSATTLKEIRLQQLINKVSTIIQEHIEPTLKGIEHYQQGGEYLFALYYDVTNNKQPIMRVEYAKLRQTLKEMMHLDGIMNRLTNELKLFSQDYQTQNLHYILRQTKHSNLTNYQANQKLLQKVIEIEGKNYYVG